MARIDVDAVERALGQVYDPCSCFLGAPQSMVDLGMVRDIRIDGRTVHVELLLDDPTCLFFFDIGQRIQEAVGGLPEVEAVVVSSAADEVWTEERMLPAARVVLSERRQQRRRAFADLGGPLAAPDRRSLPLAFP